jgi:hypothetical protein
MMATLAERNVIKAMVTLMVGSGRVCVWRESREWSQVVGFELARLETTMRIFSQEIFMNVL